MLLMSSVAVYFGYECVDNVSIDMIIDTFAIQANLKQKAI